MTPMEAILSATALGGELMLHPHELGKVVPGAYADLLLVNGDPLQDITLLSHKENLDVIVMVGLALLLVGSVALSLCRTAGFIRVNMSLRLDHEQPRHDMIAEQDPNLKL